MSTRIFFVLLLLLAALPASAQDASKRNGRPQEAASPLPERRDDARVTASDARRYTYEFKQPEFLIGHVTIEHDQQGRGKVTFERRGEETPIVEPLELSTAVLDRLFGLWTDLHFLDSDENYQAAKNFAHLGTYRIGMENGGRRRTAEFNWSGNKSAWLLVNEYRRIGEQIILVFNLKLAREMQPLNTPQLLKEMELLLTRNGLSDPPQLVPLLTELRTDDHIPLIARNQAERILKKIKK
jgi:hypothetical protein